jgi:hypothetical protein
LLPIVLLYTIRLTPFPRKTVSIGRINGTENILIIVAIIFIVLLRSSPNRHGEFRLAPGSTDSSDESPYSFTMWRNEAAVTPSILLARSTSPPVERSTSWMCSLRISFSDLICTISAGLLPVAAFPRRTPSCADHAEHTLGSGVGKLLSNLAECGIRRSPRCDLKIEEC